MTKIHEEIFSKKSMDDAVYKAVSSRSGGRCEHCGSSRPLELHHIFRRKSGDIVELCIMLCVRCHRGTNGVHGSNGHNLDVELKIDAQDRLRKKGLNDDEIRKKTKSGIVTDNDYTL